MADCFISWFDHTVAHHKAGIFIVSVHKPTINIIFVESTTATNITLKEMRRELIYWMLLFIIYE
jgi:hypothetical protein